jgi:hypothetical protein
MLLLRMWRLFCDFNLSGIIIWNIFPVGKVSTDPERFLTKCEKLPELRDRDNIPLLVECKKEFLTGLDGIYLPMQITDLLYVEEALLIIGLTQISFVKNCF